jgi:hypothetical protein
MNTPLEVWYRIGALIAFSIKKKKPNPIGRHAAGDVQCRHTALMIYMTLFAPIDLRPCMTQSSIINMPCIGCCR